VSRVVFEGFGFVAAALKILDDFLLQELNWRGSILVGLIEQGVFIGLFFIYT
jgi:hypothetical protein